MLYEVKKAENCFTDAQTYEYRLPISGEEFVDHLVGWSVRKNQSFRRPTFSADRGCIKIKGILAAKVIKISFSDTRWENEKRAFESWLSEEPL